MLRTLLLTSALVSGGAAAWLFGSMQSGEVRAADQSAVSIPIKTEEVLVAGIDLEQSSELRAEYLRWQVWPAASVPAGVFLRSRRPDASSELTGSIVRSRLVAGTPIFVDSVAPEKSSFLSSVLRQGMRAVAIRISAEKTAGGFILPNDHVDVLLTNPCQPQDGCDSVMAVRTILNNIRVLAIDQSGGENNEEGVLVGKTATLELDPLQAETIIGAEASGTLSLVLRAATDRTEHFKAPLKLNPTIRVTRGGVTEYVVIR